MRFLPSQKNRKVFGNIAEEYDLVYFGNVDPKVDTDYKIVRGLTLSPNIKDENYTTGNVYDYEVAFLQRSKQVTMTDGGKSQRTWTILHVQLKNAWLPHFLVDGRSRSEEYGHLLASTQRWREISWRYLGANPDFLKVFAIFSQPDMVSSLMNVLTEEVQAMLAAHFAQFDYEFKDDSIIVYATNQEVNLQLLDHMLRIGLWLARTIDRNSHELTI